MNYEDFKEKFEEAVKDKLNDEGLEANLSFHEVKKLNESYEALTVTPEGESIGVNIPVERFFNAYEDGMDFSETIDKAVDIINQGINERPDIDIDSLSDYSKMKGKLAIEVVSAEANKEMLESVPHKDLEDMAIVYRFVLSSGDDGRQSVVVTNQMLENFGITAEQLHADAMEIAPQLKPVEIKGMSEVLAELMGVEEAEMMGIGPVAPEDEQMYVASVPDKVHGAGVLAYEEFMDKAAERAGGDFYILPSSIHEVLIVPDNGQMDFKSLEDMVKEVNATQVAPQDKLTDSVYHYDSKDKIFELGEKFVERMAEKEAEKTSERDEKKSVLGDLKAKKEEIAKSPKKDHIDKGVKSKEAAL
ncbi:MAG: hypothetical protein IKZ39_05930 [Lachnospiraceae bacterium]|nr:hypothetical protein [Lachnospiraceae bacterium]